MFCTKPLQTCNWPALLGENPSPFLGDPTSRGSIPSKKPVLHFLQSVKLLAEDQSGSEDGARVGLPLSSRAVRSLIP